MEEKFKILHVEDRKADAELVARVLKANNINFEQLVIDSEPDFFNALHSFSPDIIFCDHSLPAFNSFQALRIVKARKLNIPFIVITATLSEEVAVTIVREGADDYVLKNRLHRLPHVVINCIDKCRNEKDRKRLIDEARLNEAVSKAKFEKLSDKLLLATKAAGIGTWEYNVKEKKFDADDILFDLYGIDPNSFDGTIEMWTTYVHPADLDEVLKEFQQALLNNASLYLDFRIVRPDGETRFLKAIIVAQEDDCGKVIRLIGTNQDVTVAKIAELAIKESEEKYRSFFENSLDGILITVPDGRILSANPAACDMFLMTEEEICKCGRSGLVDETDPRLAVQIEERKRTGKAKAEITFRRKDGTLFLGEITSSVYKNALGHERTSMIIRNINDRVVAEQKILHTSNALQKALTEVEKIMDSSLDIICSIDADGKFATVSAASYQILGFAPSELIGRRYVDLVVLKDVERTKLVAKEIVAGFPVTMFEHRMVHKNGSEVPMLWSARWNEEEQLMFAIGKDATEKKKLESDVEVERRRLQELFLHAPSSVGVFKGPEHVFAMANDLYLQLTGRKNIIGKTVREVFPEVENQGLFDLLDHVYTSGSPFSAQERLIKIDKEGNGILNDFYLNFLYHPYRNSNDEIEGVFFFAVDVTEQVKARKRIEESEKKFRQIVETAQEGIWILDHEFKALLVNQKLCDMLGYSEDEIIGKHNYDFKDEEGRSASLQRLSQRQKDKAETHESNFLTKDGRIIWTLVSTNPMFDDEGNPHGYLAMITDITQRKLWEERLREQQEQLLESQRIAHIGSWQLNLSNAEDMTDNPIFCSAETFRIFGFLPSGNAVYFKEFSHFIHPHDLPNVLDAIQIAITKQESGSMDFRIIDKDGKKRWVHQTVKVVKDSEGRQPLKVYANIKDITVEKQQALQILENNEEREILINELTKSIKDLKQFTYITSHNFRAPLSNLMGLLSLIDYEGLNDNNREIIELFKTATYQLNKTINDLVQILIIKNNVNVNVAENNLDELLDEVSNSFAYEISEFNCKIIRDLTIKNIVFNRSYLESIFINLISNSIKYRSPDRPLEIVVKTSQLANGEVRLAINDNGLGIDLNRHRENIFGLYQRFHSNTDGAGLGLFMVKSQITALGGSIDVESEVGKGTTFYITLKEKLK